MYSNAIERTPGEELKYLQKLEELLQADPLLHVGEIGLDKCFQPTEEQKTGFKYKHQFDVFQQQLKVRSFSALLFNYSCQ